MQSCHVRPAMRMALLCVAVSLCFGCGKYKEELEQQKQQVGTLQAQVQRLSETSASLDKEKSRLGDELKALSDKNASLQKEMADLKKVQNSQERETGELKKRNSELQDQLESLKRQKTDLEREVGELNQRLSELAPPEKPSQAEPSEKAPQVMPGPVSSAATPPTPCDAVIQYMKRSGEIVRLNKGDQREKLLKQLKQELAHSMKGAPAKAVKSADAWVKELSATWDKRHDDSVYNLLSLRNAALDACGKKPEDAGF